MPFDFNVTIKPTISFKDAQYVTFETPRNAVWPVMTP